MVIISVNPYGDICEGGLIALAPEVSNLTQKGHIAKRDRVFPTLQRDPYISLLPLSSSFKYIPNFTIFVSLSPPSLRKDTHSPPISLRPILIKHKHTKPSRVSRPIPNRKDCCVRRPDQLTHCLVLEARLEQASLLKRVCDL